MIIATVPIGDEEFQIAGIDAIKQFHIVRRLGPGIITLVPLLELIPQFVGLLTEETPSLDEEARALMYKKLREALREALPSVADAFAHLSDEDANYVINNCLDYTWRKQEKGWAKVRANGQIMFADLTMPTIMRLVFEVVKANLSDVFPTGQPQASAAGQ